MRWFFLVGVFFISVMAACGGGYGEDGPRSGGEDGAPSAADVRVTPAGTPLAGGGFAMPAACDRPLDWSQAAAHAGETVQAIGPVVGSRVEDAVADDYAVLEVGAAHPADGGLDVGVPLSALGEDAERDLFAGDVICVEGAVTVAGGRARIDIMGPDEIFVREDN
jgi:hypothetical protein